MNVQEKQSTRVLTRNILNVPLRLNQRITVSEEVMLRYLLGRNISVSFVKKRFGIYCGGTFQNLLRKTLWHLWKNYALASMDEKLFG